MRNPKACICVAMEEKTMKKCADAVACLLLRIVIGAHAQKKRKCVLNENKLKTEYVGWQE